MSAPKNVNVALVANNKFETLEWMRIIKEKLLKMNLWSKEFDQKTFIKATTDESGNESVKSDGIEPGESHWQKYGKDGILLEWFIHESGVIFDFMLLPLVLEIVPLRVDKCSLKLDHRQELLQKYYYETCRFGSPFIFTNHWLQLSHSSNYQGNKTTMVRISEDMYMKSLSNAKDDQGSSGGIDGDEYEIYTLPDIQDNIGKSINETDYQSIFFQALHALHILHSHAMVEHADLSDPSNLIVRTVDNVISIVIELDSLEKCVVDSIPCNFVLLLSPTKELVNGFNRIDQGRFLCKLVTGKNARLHPLLETIESGSTDDSENRAASQNEPICIREPDYRSKEGSIKRLALPRPESYFKPWDKPITIYSDVWDIAMIMVQACCHGSGSLLNKHYQLTGDSAFTDDSPSIHDIITLHTRITYHTSKFTIKGRNPIQAITNRALQLVNRAKRNNWTNEIKEGLGDIFEKEIHTIVGIMIWLQGLGYDILPDDSENFDYHHNPIHELLRDNLLRKWIEHISFVDIVTFSDDKEYEINLDDDDDTSVGKEDITRIGNTDPRDLSHGIKDYDLVHQFRSEQLAVLKSLQTLEETATEPTINSKQQQQQSTLPNSGNDKKEKNSNDSKSKHVVAQKMVKKREKLHQFIHNMIIDKLGVGGLDIIIGMLNWIPEERCKSTWNYGKLSQETLVKPTYSTPVVSEILRSDYFRGFLEKDTVSISRMDELIGNAKSGVMETSIKQAGIRIAHIFSENPRDVILGDNSNTLEYASKSMIKVLNNITQ